LHGSYKSRDLSPMAFVLAQAKFHHLLAAVAYEVQAPKVVEDAYRTAAKELDPLLGKAPVAIANIRDGP
jgi:hypothetical protein